jgi:hypothetical protein
VSTLIRSAIKLIHRGADDDGSGTTSSLEALRSLAAAKFTPATPVEFHYFSAEEGGLLGSQAVAKSYEDKGIKVKAMLQMDMTAWVKQGTKESVGIIQDFVDPDLTQFLEGLVGKYRELLLLSSAQANGQWTFLLSKRNVAMLVPTIRLSAKPAISHRSRKPSGIDVVFD